MTIKAYLLDTNSPVRLVYKLEVHQPRSLPTAKRRAKVRGEGH